MRRLLLGRFLLGRFLLGRFLLARAALLIGTMLVASVAIYGALYLAPGDPIAVLTGGRQVTPEFRAELTARYHLDEPLPLRWWRWLTSALHGDLGYSIASRQDVSTLIAQRSGVTLQLLAATSVLVVLAGVATGILAALRPGIVDTAVLVTTTVLAAVPSFVTALVLISVFAVGLGWFPALGEGGLAHLVLPSVALATSSLALVARITRTSVRAELRREHVQTAVSRGLPRATILRRHVLRNAAVPITAVTGLTLASLVVLVSIVEEAFALNGIGAALVTAAQNKDVAVVQAIALLMVASFVVINAVVDLLYAALDPRVGLGAAAP